MAGKTYEDFLSLGINFLKNYVNVRGFATSGYSKVELVARVFSPSQMNLPIVISSAEQKQSLIKDYIKQLREYGQTDALKVPVSERTSNICDWPRINLCHIFDCILKIEFQRDYIGCYKDEKNYSYFDSGFVDEIFLYISDVAIIIGKLELPCQLAVLRNCGLQIRIMEKY